MTKSCAKTTMKFFENTQEDRDAVIKDQNQSHYKIDRMFSKIVKYQNGHKKEVELADVFSKINKDQNYLSVKRASCIETVIATTSPMIANNVKFNFNNAEIKSRVSLHITDDPTSNDSQRKITNQLAVGDCSLKNSNIGDIIKSKLELNSIVEENKEDVSCLSHNDDASNLFIEFFIAGVDNEYQLPNVQKGNVFITEYTLQPKVLDSFMHTQFGCYDKAYDTFIELNQTSLLFIFPFGCTVEKQDHETSQNLINDSIYENIAHSNKEASNFYQLCLNSNQTMNISEGNMPNILKICNPNYFHYYYIAQFDDFHFIPKNDGDDYQVFKSQKTIAIKSFYPFHELYFSILKLVLHKIQQKKSQLYSDLIIEKKHHCFGSQPDSESTNQIIIKDIYPILAQLLQKKIEDTYPAKISFSKEIDIHYTIPDEKGLTLCEGQYGFSDVFNDICYEDWMFILSSILMERTIVFVSPDMRTLTCFLMTFSSQIKPFKWPYPIIYSLPENAQPMLQSPLPILVGLKQSMKYVAKNIQPEYGAPDNDTIYFFLEEKWILCDKDVVANTTVLNFGGYFYSLKTRFANLFSKKPSKVLKITTDKQKEKSRVFKLKKSDQTIKDALKYQKSLKSNIKSKLSGLRNFMSSGKDIKARDSNLRGSTKAVDSMAENSPSDFKNQPVLTGYSTFNKTGNDNGSMFQEELELFFERQFIRKLPKKPFLIEDDAFDLAKFYDAILPRNFKVEPEDSKFLEQFTASQTFMYKLEKIYKTPQEENVSNESMVVVDKVF